MKKLALLLSALFTFSYMCVYGTLNLETLENRPPYKNLYNKYVKNGKAFEEKYIKDCLNSLDKQSIENFEVILVDDGSTDSTIDVIKKLKIKILTKKI